MAKYLDISGLETLWGHITSKLSTKADKDGSNATGTWGIGISGNAATATKDSNGNTITSTYATKSELNDVSTLVGNTAVSTQITNAVTTAINGLNIQNGSRSGALRSVGSTNESDSYTMGEYAFAEGQDTKANGSASHAEGWETTSSGKGSHAEGTGTTASAPGSHAEGVGTTASEQSSHSEGVGTTASKQAAHAEGQGTTASGAGSHAEGVGTIASSSHQHVQGKYNIKDASNKYAHIVGNGSDGISSNAHTLDWNGVGWFAGGVKVGGTNQDDASRVYAENYKPALTDLSGTLAIAQGGTGANTAAQARHNIGADHAYNILVNSYFKDPVNSGGRTSWTNWNDYTIDRWIFRNNPVSEASIDVSGMSITTGSSEIYFEQSFDKSANQFYIGKPLTLVFSTNEGLLIKKWTVVDGSYSRESIGNFQMTIGCQTNFWIDLVVPANKTINIYWAALYEGSYTVDTLPAYIPYPKRVEMLRCGIATNPPNLLVNSNFADPVNSNGKTTYSNYTNTIDKWFANYDTTLTLQNGYVRLSDSWDIRQKLNIKDGTYTMAVMAKINVVSQYKQAIRIEKGTQSAELLLGDEVGVWKIYSINKTFTDNDDQPLQFIIDNREGNVTNASMDIKWAALYEGAYTADTLSAYVPYLKQVEMIRCGVSLQPHNLLDNSDFTNPVNQRGQTQKSENGYFIDRWMNYTGSQELVAGGVKTTASGNTAYISQYIESAVLHDGVYSFAAKVNGSVRIRVIRISGTTITTVSNAEAGFEGGYLNATYANSGRFEFMLRVEDGNSIVTEWAALYEGSYTADTLPAYVPKGYGAELAECQRYYKKYNGLIQFPVTITKASEAAVAIDYTDMRITPTIEYNLAGLYVGDALCSAVGNILPRTLPSSELVANIGTSVAAYKTGTIRFKSLALSADL